MAGGRLGSRGAVDDAALRRKVQRGFRLRGLSVQVDACDALVNVLARETEQKKALKVLLDAIKVRLRHQDGNRSNSRNSGLVDIDIVSAVVADLSKDDNDLMQEAIVLISSFAMPEVKYNPTRRQFYALPKSPSAKGTLHANAALKCGLFRERYTLLFQRLMRHPLFAPPLLAGMPEADTTRVELTQLEALVGTEENMKHCLLGLLSRLEDENYYLEDLNGRVRVDLSSVAECHVGMFTEGCIVLVEGVLSEGIFRVQSLASPPSETRAKSISANGGDEFHFGNDSASAVSAHESRRLKALEKKATDTMFVMLSDVHLDSPVVFSKLRELFAGCEPLCPPVFVFMGNFTQKPFGVGATQCRPEEFRAHFARLGKLISEFPGLVKYSHFIFVPGPLDPGSANVYPRSPIPDTFSNALGENLPQSARYTFTTNPCRIKFYTQEIVLFRDDIVSKMRRNCVVQPSESFHADGKPVQLTEHLVQTLIDQAHLSPLPIHVRPTYWQYDAAMRLYPTPDVLILADHYDQYYWNYNASDVFNPGSFPTDFSFVVYRPASREVEFSKIE